MAEWIVFGAIALVAIAGTLYLSRSLRRWRQPPPGRDETAESAENRLRWLTYRNLPD